MSAVANQWGVWRNGTWGSGDFAAPAQQATTSQRRTAGSGGYGYEFYTQKDWDNHWRWGWEEPYHWQDTKGLRTGGDPIVVTFTPQFTGSITESPAGTFTRTAGSGWDNAWVVSLESYDDVTFEFVPAADLSKQALISFTTTSNPSVIGDYDWGFYIDSGFSGSGVSSIHAGAYQGIGYNAGEKLRMERVGTDVTLYVNGVSAGTSSIGSGAVYFAIMLNPTGAAVEDVELNPPEDLNQTLTPTLYTSNQSFFAPTLTATYTLTPSLFTNSQSFFAASVTVGAVTLTPALFTNSQSFFAPAVARGAVTLTPALFTNSQTFFAPAVSRGAVFLTPSLFTNTQTFHAPTVTRGEVNLAPSLFANAQSFFAPTVNAGAVSVTPALFTNSQTFFSPVVSSGAGALFPSLFTNTQTFHAATVAPGAVGLTPTLLSNANQFFAPSLTAANDLGPPLVSSGNVIFLPSVGFGVQTVLPSLFVNLTVHFGATLTIRIAIPPARVASPAPINRAASPTSTDRIARAPPRVIDPEVSLGSRIVRPSRRLA